MRICKVISQLTISFFCCAGSLFNLLWAEEHNDSVQMNLVYFAPSVYIPEKTLPCQGVRLVGSRILTSSPCYQNILSLLDQAVVIEVLNVEGETIGRIKKADVTGMSANYLSMESDSAKTKSSSVSLSHTDITNNTVLMAYYLMSKNEGVTVAKQSFMAHRLLNSEDQMFIQLPFDDQLPDGAIVSYRNELLCIVSGDICLMPGSLMRATRWVADPECQDTAIKEYHYDCGKRTITACQHAVDSYRFGAEYWQLLGYCNNPVSQQNCSFYYSYSTDSQGNIGIIDVITCHSCYAYYVNTDIFNDPAKENDCSPSGCIHGCPPGNKGSRTPVIVGSTVGAVGGIVLVGAVATVTGCLIYKYRHKAGYQSM